jgi:3'-5' exoribonuclease
MKIYLTANEIIKQAEVAEDDFNFDTRLQVFDQVEDKTRAGDPYLKLTLRDCTNEIRNVKKWINKERKDDLEVQRLKFAIGNILEIEGQYNLKFGPSITHSKLLTFEQYNLEDFVQSPKIDADSLFNFLSNIISNIQDNFLKKLLEKIFSDDDIKKKFIESPSSIIHHHSYKHGNLEHTVGMLKIFERLVEHYNRNTNLDVDLIYTGIILHDIGKSLEYSLNNGVPKKNPGADLHGHLILGAQLVSRFMNQIESFPRDKKNQIRHLILSHHGKKEWDSVIEPQFPEAEILHYLDMIDSRFKHNY